MQGQSDQGKGRNTSPRSCPPDPGRRPDPRGWHPWPRLPADHAVADLSDRGGQQRDPIGWQRRISGCGHRLGPQLRLSALPGRRRHDRPKQMSWWRRLARGRSPARWPSVTGHCRRSCRSPRAPGTNPRGVRVTGHGARWSRRNWPSPRFRPRARFFEVTQGLPGPPGESRGQTGRIRGQCPSA